MATGGTWDVSSGVVASELARLRSVVDKQAEDDGLWFIAQTVTESYLQQELRSLHWAVESLITALTPSAPTKGE